MDGPVKNIILTSDYQEKGSADYENLSTDVIVQFESGDEYIAAFVSAKSLEKVIHELDSSDETGSPYEILNYVLIKDFNNGDLRPIIDTMLAEGDFQIVFKKVWWIVYSVSDSIDKMISKQQLIVNKREVL